MAMFCRAALIKNKPAIDLADIGRSLKKIVMRVDIIPGAQINRAASIKRPPSFMGQCLSMKNQRLEVSPRSPLCFA